MTKHELKAILAAFKKHQRQTIKLMMKAYNFRPLADYSIDHLEEGYIFPQSHKPAPKIEKALSTPFSVSSFMDDVSDRVLRRNSECLILGKERDYSFMLS